MEKLGGEMEEEQSRSVIQKSEQAAEATEEFSGSWRTV